MEFSGLVRKLITISKKEAKIDRRAGVPLETKLVNDIKHYPHAFVLWCVVNLQMRADKAVLIPWEISREIGGFSMKKLLKLSLADYKRIFRKRHLHRFNEKMATNFYKAVQRIHSEYQDDASRIWEKKPSSATVVRKFLEFEGVGIKLASMATNILVRQHGIPIADKINIDISPDVHVQRVFMRLGLVNNGCSREVVLYKARELNPRYPGIFDRATFFIGYNYCHPQHPKCDICPMKDLCLHFCSSKHRKIGK